MKFLSRLCASALIVATAYSPAQAAPKKQAETSASPDQMAVAMTFAQCWVPEYDEPTVRLYMLMNQDTSVAYINVVDAEKKRYMTDGVYRKSADNAINAVKHCPQLKSLQGYSFDTWQELELTFDPKIIGKHHIATVEEKAALNTIIASCWKTVANPYPIKLSLRMEADATIHSIHVQDTEKELYRSIAAYKQATDDAFEAFKNCPALQGFRQYPYEIWKELDIAFTPPAAEYYNVQLSIIPQGQ